MKQNRWRVILVVFLSLWALYSVAPSFIYFSTPKDVRTNDQEFEKLIPEFLPKQHVKLGLDLQGGVQLVLGVNTDDAVDNKLARVATETMRWSKDNDKGVDTAFALDGKQTLRIVLKDGQDAGEFKSEFLKEYAGFEQVARDGQKLDLAYSSDQISRIKQSSVEQAERVIRSRVDKWGVANPMINRRAVDNSILVQLPGFRDPSKAKELLGRTAQLKFHLVDDTFKQFADVQKLPEGITKTNHGQPALASQDREALMAFVSTLNVPEDKRVFVQREELAGGRAYQFTTYVVQAATEVGGDDILDAYVSEDTSGIDRQPVVSMRFTGPGGKRFGDVTGANINKRLAIVLDDEVVSAPNIRQKIATGQAQIEMGSGNFNQKYEEANDLALILKSGALPATIEVKEERRVGATLGPELADEGVKGTIVGLMLVLAFMVGFYRRPGVVACVALVLNGIYLLAMMAGFGFALTLPGIAGFILTLGMAVDANVLINERIRQELKEGKNAKKAVENGFKKVFWTIIDANVTTLIAALVLLETNSSGPVKGFAITLMLGLIVSLFTSLYVTKLLFDLLLAGKTSDSQVRSWLGGESAVKRKYFNFNFLKFGKIASAVGIGIAVAVIATGAIRGVNFGVDFAGGTEIMVGFKDQPSPDEVRDVATSVGIKSLTLQSLEGSRYLVRFGQQQKTKGSAAKSNEEAVRVQDFQTALASQLAAKSPEILQVDYVGPQIGKQLQSEGFLSVFYALLGVLIYIGLRFDMRFGPGAVIKMILDIFILSGFYIFAWQSFDLTSVAAFLTVVGYSVNDTIVIYDRIRENMTVNAKRTLFENINISLNETLTRTINTSVTTVFALIGILVFGSGQIWTFAMAMAVGVIAATLSSQFLASSLLLWLEGFKKKRRASEAAKMATAR